MSNICDVCDDFVSEYGEPVCLCCYNRATARAEKLAKELETIKKEQAQLLSEFLKAQRKLKLRGQS